eukprot:scaffold3183_cov120-Isochrysis_galbana.AAC.1
MLHTSIQTEARASPGPRNGAWCMWSRVAAATDTALLARTPPHPSCASGTHDHPPSQVRSLSLVRRFSTYSGGDEDELHRIGVPPDAIVVWLRAHDGKAEAPIERQCGRVGRVHMEGAHLRPSCGGQLDGAREQEAADALPSARGCDDELRHRGPHRQPLQDQIARHHWRGFPPAQTVGGGECAHVGPGLVLCERHDERGAAPARLGGEVHRLVLGEAPSLQRAAPFEHASAEAHAVVD